MVSPAIYKVQDIYPHSIQFINENWEPLKVNDYILITPDGQKAEGKSTNEKGFVLASDLKIGGKIKFAQPEIESEEKQEIESESSCEINEYPENPGPLPVLDLRNRSEGGKGPLKRNDSRRSLVEHLQSMLNYLGYYLGESGPGKDGVDGLFQDRTSTAVKNFQRSNKDWDSKRLRVDGIVGPRTCDALNRELVGIWYSKYGTPVQLTSCHKLVVMTEGFAKREGLTIG